MLILHVEAPTMNELIKAALTQLHINLIPEAQPVQVPPALPVVDELSKKRGRPPMKTAEPTVPVPPPAAPPAAVVGAPPAARPPVPPDMGHAAVGALTIEDARAALHSVTVKVQGDTNESMGLKRASAVLTKLGYRKISDVKPEDFAKLIEECRATMKDLTVQA